jgi:hypothetical protein
MSGLVRELEEPTPSSSALPWRKPFSAAIGPDTPLAQREGKVFRIRAHAVPPTGLLGIATAATCFGGSARQAQG